MTPEMEMPNVCMIMLLLRPGSSKMRVEVSGTVIKPYGLESVPTSDPACTSTVVPSGTVTFEPSAAGLKAVAPQTVYVELKMSRCGQS
jgi:hypothetical protein